MAIIRIRIEITKSCIKRGVCSNPSSCAAALAIGKVIKRGEMIKRPNISLGTSEITISVDDDYCWMNTPVKLQYFINKFDDGKRHVKPMSFYLDIPKRFLKASAIKVGK